MSNKVIYFNRFPVTNQVFYRSKYTYALVNLKPIVAGHVLIVPYRVVPRLKDLTKEENQDYFETLQKIHRFIEYLYKADSLNISIQDGAAAGQSVPHLHTHILPRYFTDGYGDAIYDKLQQNGENLNQMYQEQQQQQQQVPTKKLTVPEERIPRTMEEMQVEAKWLANELEKFHLENW
ncbi:hypothetical protein PACTADRAFT_3436 [Pachysolen tannophilus NRRL Y-2460]|uniref:Bis(5'-adenosyl)-triphosphatase n=1 Tax=Pachysolen tannophilus NRRL Y-2460 TaxID=669874 RepID=A0A1E4TS10_PACTA|nr:hypothetical protein PACTADRAFT_3436 [Pachysolen tannophilus NRRL Y-2460]